MFLGWGRGGLGGWEGAGAGEADWSARLGVWVGGLLTLGETSSCSPSQALLFLQTGTADLFTDSRISLVCGDSQAQGVTLGGAQKVYQLRKKYVACRPASPALLWHKHCPFWQTDGGSALNS